VVDVVAVVGGAVVVGAAVVLVVVVEVVVVVTTLSGAGNELSAEQAVATRTSTTRTGIRRDMATI
jgi:hypothetical protein